MRALVEEGEPNVAKRMQELALSEGALLTHLLIALFTRDDDKRLLAHRQLSRHLVGLWVTNNDTAMNLLTRILVSCRKYVALNLSDLIIITIGYLMLAFRIVEFFGK